MARSIWKSTAVNATLAKLISRRRKNVWSRSSVIPGFLVDSKIFIHNGHELRPVTLTKVRVGYKFGEFATTRKPFVYKEKKKKDKYYGTKSQSP